MCSSQKIGLIAGQGQLPELLLSKWESSGLTPVVVGLQDITPLSLLSSRIARVFSIGQAGHILSYLKENGVEQLVMVGGMHRPNFWTLRTDVFGLKIIAKILLKRPGDDGLLKLIRREIENLGFVVEGVHKYLPDILSPLGTLGDVQPNEKAMQSIRFGFKQAKAHGQIDKGQSVIVTDDGHVHFETVSGTNALIQSVAGFKNPILVKVSKPQQDLDLDMPTIGLPTVRMAIDSGLQGIAVEAGRSIIIDRASVIDACNKAGLFLVGIGDDR